MHMYSRLSFTERQEINRGLASDEAIRGIAKRLGRDAGTVTRETNSDGMTALTYRAEGQEQAELLIRKSRGLAHH